MINQSNIAYILRSVHHRDRFYIGITDDVQRRLSVHGCPGAPSALMKS